MLNEILTKEEEIMMMQIFGEIVSLDRLESYLEWDEMQSEHELETQREFIY